ncbi:MAG: ABC transporter ATP-binding protein [Eubacterium sp.]|nr:ABC transporter ATP-binding protein [Eubacterium sp.]
MLLCVNNLKIHFKDAAPDRFAVNGVSFGMKKGEILGLVGESGSGKTVTAMAISGLLPENAADTWGNITLDGRELLQCDRKSLQDLQGDEISVVFQEPMTSMNPLLRVGPQVEECLRIHTKLSRKERKDKALEALQQVDLPDPEDVYRKYPHELSGGMLQRAMIAAAIINKPQLLLADEPTTALDVTIQEEILKLLIRLNQETNTAILFISHNLNVVRKLCGRVIVMQRGIIVENGSTEDVFYNPQHEYTKKLIAAIPTREHRMVADWTRSLISSV